MAPHYSRIESLMDNYSSSFANTSILGGLTTGIGGLTTSITFATVDTISLSLQLYWLSQRFAILNGFDSNKPLHQAKRDRPWKKLINAPTLIPGKVNDV